MVTLAFLVKLFSLLTLLCAKCLEDTADSRQLSRLHTRAMKVRETIIVERRPEYDSRLTIIQQCDERIMYSGITIKDIGEKQ